jgi:hypothetical protein
MEFVNKLRNVKDQSKETAQRALDRIRESGVSLERHLRQKMRIYPRSAKPAANSPNPGPQTATIFEEELEQTQRAEFQERRPIVSVRGKDLEPAESDAERRKTKSDRRIA